MGVVLIVDDDPAIRTSIRHTLVAAGFETLTAEHGFDALRMLDDVRPDCLLLDLNMPVLDGYGVLRMLRKRQDHLPVLVMTADPAGHRLGPADGVAGLVPKPFRPEALVAAVTRVLTSAAVS
jgi:CheY-like chemotaxis protein